MPSLRDTLPGLVRVVPLKLFSMVLTTVVFIFLIPYTLHALGTYAYGVLVIAQTVTTYLSLSECGFGLSLERELSVCLGQQKQQRYRQVFWAGVQLFFWIAVFIFLLTLVLCSVFVWQQNALLAWVVFYSGAALAFTMLFEPIASAMRARLFFISWQLFIIVMVIVAAGVQYLVLAAGGDVVAVACSQLVVAMAVRFGLAVLLLPHLRIGQPLWRKNKDITKTLIHYSFKTFFVRMAEIIQQKMDTLIAAALGGMQKVAPYSLAADVNSRMHGITIFFVALLNPFYARVIHDQERQIKMYLFSWKFAITISGAVWAVTVLLGKPFMHLWLGTGFEQSATILAVLSCAWFLQKAQSPAENVLYAYKQQHQYAFMLLGEVFVSLAGMAFLYTFWQKDIVCIAYGLLIGTILVRCSSLPFLVSKLLGKSAWWYLWCFLKNVLILGGSLLFAWSVLESIPVHSVLMFLAQVVWYLLVCGIALLCMFSSAERQLFVEAIKRSRFRVK